MGLPGAQEGPHRGEPRRPQPAPPAGRSSCEHDVLGPEPVQAAREDKLTGPRLLASTGHRRVFVLAPTLLQVWSATHE